MSCPNDVSKQKRGTPSNISIIMYGMRNDPVETGINGVMGRMTHIMIDLSIEALCIIYRHDPPIFAAHCLGRDKCPRIYNSLNNFIP